MKGSTIEQWREGRQEQTYSTDTQTVRTTEVGMNANMETVFCNTVSRLNVLA